MKTTRADRLYSRKGLSCRAMAYNAPETIGEVIDYAERLREELLTLQSSLEKMERARAAGSDAEAKTRLGSGGKRAAEAKRA